MLRDCEALLYLLINFYSDENWQDTLSVMVVGEIVEMVKMKSNTLFIDFFFIIF